MNFQVPARQDLSRKGSLGMGGHQSAGAGTVEWLTPPKILDALGPFDLDPCASITRPWPIATQHFTIEEDGLLQEWEGRVWCNPPYGRHTWKWLTRLALHGDGIALIFARTETKGFFHCVWNLADGLLFLRGRLSFFSVDGKEGRNAGAPSVLVAYGAGNRERLRNCSLSGKFIALQTK